MRRTLAALGLGIGLAAAAAAQDASAQTTLTFNRWLPPTHPFQTRILDPWAEEVRRATEGRVVVEFTASSLGPPPRQYDLARTGGVDIVFSFTGYTPDRFPLGTMLGLPFIGDSAEAVGVSFWDIHHRLFHQAGEFRGVHLLGVIPGPPGQIFTTRRVRTLDDYRGLKIRSADPVLNAVVEALGAVPVFGPASQSYEMHANGVVDGGGYYFDSVVSFDLARFVPNAVLYPGGLVNGSFFLVVNEGRWRRLSERDRAAIMEVSGPAFARAAGRALDELEVAAKQRMEASGADLWVPDEALAGRVRALMEPIERAWIEQARAKGVDGAAALRELRGAARAYRPQG
jgi:TRAP-type C4-dicarboxylate transport system substrate-binding protein